MSDNAITNIHANNPSMHVFRYAFGSALIMMVAMGADYTLSFLTPVLALNFMGPNTRTPGLRTSAVFVFSVAATIISGVLMADFLLEYPLVFLPVLLLAVFHLYYTTSMQQVKVWWFISLLAIPLIKMESPEMGNTIAINLFLNAMLAIILVMVVWIIFPSGDTNRGTPAAAKASVSEGEKFIAALNKTLVVTPIIILFYILSLSDALLILVFVAVLSMNPATSNPKAGAGVIVGNLAGGLAAILAYNLLTIVPVFLFMGLLVLLAGLLFGERVFSGKPTAALFNMGFSTFLLILGNVTAVAGEAGDKVWTRIFQISIVVVYMIFAFKIADALTSRLRTRLA
jgi:hypothetical protein